MTRLALVASLALLGCTEVLGLGEDDDQRGVWTGATGLVLAVSDTMRISVIHRDGRDYHQWPSSAFPWPAGLVARWESSDGSVATIDDDGLVTARGPGRATLWAEVNGMRDSATVTVVDADATTLPPLATISAGGGFTCGVSDRGTAACWGTNWNGELGIGRERRFTAYLSPAPLPSGVEWRSIDAGVDHSCAIAMDGSAYCWGVNSTGALGDGTNDNRPAPTRVRAERPLQAIGAGNDHTCALDRGGVAYCWGGNRQGQLGTGDGRSATTPRPVAGGLTFSSLSVGPVHSCALTMSGEAHCWGDNQSGALGAPGKRGSVPVRVEGDLRFTQISAGRTHSCAVATDARAYCWGANSVGQLGTGTESVAGTPALVSGDLRFASISAGGEHSCGVTLTHAAYCWGRNVWGTLGNGVEVGRSVGPGSYDLYYVRSPVAVIGGIAFASMSAGEFDHTCGVATDGRGYCWGADGSGALGHGQWLYATGIAYPVLTPVSTRPIAVRGEF